MMKKAKKSVIPVKGAIANRSRAITNEECVLKKVECLSSKQGSITKK
ncbi:hypothetical protein [Bacillus cereus]|nr:hypothetical protein [Bacillus cereus]